jgi:L-lysine exporter family protein LysE/ArgO
MLAASSLRPELGMIGAFLHGYLLALGLILPLGPQNAFVISQGATQPRLIRALPVVITAGLADTLLVLLAVLGVSALVISLPAVRLALIVIGVVFLGGMGWLTWRSTPVESAEEAAQAWPPGRQVMFALSVSLLNPHAILDTIGVIGTGSLAYGGIDKAAFTGGVILNSWLWFLGLALLGHQVGGVGDVRRWLNRASAIVMWISAAYLAITIIP